MSDTPTPVSPASPAIPPRRLAPSGWLVLAGGLLIIGVLSLWVWSPGKAPTEPPSAGTRVSTVAVDQVSIASLREQTRRNPRDGRGWALLAYAAVEQEAYAEAATAFEKAAMVSSKVATDPGVLCDWADALGMAQGGKLYGKPTELIYRALALRADYPKALEMAGSAAYEDHQFSLAADYWGRLLKQMPEGTTGRRALEEGIARAERLVATPPL